MALHNHKVGEIVEVFGDPVSKLMYQGKAKIVFVDPEHAHYYKVIFVELGQVERVGRYIY